jgi:ubiquinone biosynthesis protein
MPSSADRAREVALVLMHQGAGLLGDQLDLRVVLPGIHRAPPAGPLRLRRALEELGPTFIKLGQVLSTRPDLVPPSYERELAKLQDHAPAVPADDIVGAIEHALGRSVDEAYGSFERVPIASASIGQVHAATLPDGTEVVVKVRRPGVVPLVQVDLQLIERLAGFAARQSTLIERYNPVGLAQEFATTLGGELDYAQEGRNAEKVAAGFADDDRIHIPRIDWDRTTDCVITEARVRGVKIDDVAALARDGVDRAAVAEAFVNAYLTMVFVRGFFHADPHPGNVFVEPGGRIGFVDWGMVGAVSDTTRHGLGTVLLALVATDAAQMTDGFLSLGIATEGVDREGLEADLAKILDKHAHVALQHLRVGPLVAEIMSVVRAHRLRLPSDLALLLKTVMMVEGVAALLHPEFELVPMLVPYAQQIVTGT